MTATIHSDDCLVDQTEANRIQGGVSGMTTWRRVKAGIIPPPKKINGRNYWWRSELIAALQDAADREAHAVEAGGNQ